AVSATFFELLFAIRCERGSKSGGVALAGADSHGVFEAEDENLAVADLAGLGRGGNRVDDLVDLIRSDGDFDLELRQEAHRVFSAAVYFRVALLTSVSFDLGDGHPVHANSGQSIADIVELEWLDNGHDNFHGFYPPLGSYMPNAARQL